MDQGEVLGIIGPSGSGKSTLLRIATGLEKADGGTIEKNGSVGLVFQNFNLFPHYSVMKNIVDAPIKVQREKRMKFMSRQGSCWLKWGSQTERMPIRFSSLEDSSSGSLSRGPWR